MAQGTAFRVIPSLDLIDGRAVRLLRGAFDDVTDYGDPVALAQSWNAPAGTRVHVVDLLASRRGGPIETAAVSRIARLGLSVQVGGGVRSVRDAKRWFDAGATAVVVGTVAADDPALLRELVTTFGAERILPAVDIRNGEIRIAGWEQSSANPLDAVQADLETLGFAEVLVTNIATDGTLAGPSFSFYRDLARKTTMRVIASGGVGNANDVAALSRIGGLSGVVIGKALHEGRVTFAEANSRVAQTRSVPERIIPCLDVRGGRVVKGVQFESLRDAGDPVECAIRYEDDGADELVVLDISATNEERATSLETIRAISESLFIPLTVGGGVRNEGDFRALLQAGADRVAMNTAAVLDPSLVERMARAFGSQAVVVAVDAKRVNGHSRVVIRAGREETELDAVAWCRCVEELGAGEILLTSMDRDGTAKGYDLGQLRDVTSATKISVIASGGAGSPRDFLDAIESGGASGILAASLFHDRKLTIGDVKRYLVEQGIEMRM